MDVLDAYIVFEGGTRCAFTSSFTRRKEWEEFIRVETSETMLTLEFTNPYVKNSPFQLHEKRGSGPMENTTVQASYEESFKCELEQFIDCIENGRTVRTTLEEERDDVARFIEMFQQFS